ncbi:MAG: MFS transporter [Actinophytocola sp.]|nr:MFS transporter [Actinophytocola sp.]
MAKRSTRSTMRASRMTSSVPRVGGAGFVSTLAISMGIGPLLIYSLTATGPLVISDLDLTRAQFGSFATVAFAAAAVSSGLFGRLIDRYSERSTVIVLHVGSAVALLVAAIAQSYLIVIVAVAISGSVQALSNPVTNRLISAYAEPKAHGLLMGVKQAGVQMAQFTAGIAVPGIALVMGWRGALTASIVIAAAGLLLTLRYIPRPHGRTERDADAPLSGATPRAIWWLTAYALLTGAALQAANVYLPLYGYERVHLSVTAAGLTAAVVGGIGLIARIAWGQLADRLGSPRIPLIILPLVACVGTTCIYLAEATQTAALLWLGAAIFGATGIAANVVLMVAVLQGSPAHLIGKVSGLLATGLYLGFALGPISFGALVDATQSYGIGWLTISAAYAAAPVLVLAVRRRTS